MRFLGLEAMAFVVDTLQREAAAGLVSTIKMGRCCEEVVAVEQCHAEKMTARPIAGEVEDGSCIGPPVVVEAASATRKQRAPTCLAAAAAKLNL